MAHRSWASAIPKSVQPERIVENINNFDFAMTGDDVAAIDAIETGVRSGPDPEVVDWKTSPIRIED